NEKVQGSFGLRSFAPGSFLPRSWFLSDGDVIGVGHADEIQQPRDNNEFGAIVGGSVRNGALSPVHNAGHDIKSSRSQITHESQDVENISAIRTIHAPLHGEPKEKHGSDGEHDQQTTNPAFLDEVLRARNKPSDGGREQ